LRERGGAREIFKNRARSRESFVENENGIKIFYLKNDARNETSRARRFTNELKSFEIEL
jgi:hypothetical protein